MLASTTKGSPDAFANAWHTWRNSVMAPSSGDAFVRGLIESGSSLGEGIERSP